MRKLILIVSVFFSLVIDNVYGQTLKETQDWIKEKIELNSYSDENQVTNNYTVEFTDEQMIIKDLLETSIGGINSSNIIIYWVPIKEMMEIRFEEKTNNIWLFIQTKNNSNLIRTKMGSQEYEYENKIEILLEKSIKEDDLPNRLKTAFNHLIELYGGTINIETF